MNWESKNKRERELADRAQKGDQVAASELIKSMDPFILSIVRNREASRSIDKDDLIQIARMGVLRAIKKWDGVKYHGAFITYAGQWIRSNIQRHLERDLSPLTISYGAVSKAVISARHENLENEDSPSVVQANNLLASKFFSLNQKSRTDEGGLYSEFISDPEIVLQDEIVENNDRITKVNSTISEMALTQIEKIILKFRIMQDPPMIFDELLEKFKINCSRQYLARMEKKLIINLAAAIGNKFPWITERGDIVHQAKLSIENNSIRNKKYNSKRTKKLEDASAS